ncbi:MAG: DUF302 domain-containing protein [Sedimentisphaerales bacterium]|nr:DUF302 domain-containing protein [Sedimentisphaerales bacterium]
MNDNQISSEPRKKSPLPFFLFGMLVGIVMCGVAVYILMPRMMIVTKECNQGVDETIAALEKSIVANGWVISGIKEMNQSLAAHGVDFNPPVKQISLCKPECARCVLESDRHLSCIMPCTFSVWEGDDGKVYLSKMNTALMGKMFGGKVAKIMGGNVARDDAKILEGLLKN